jgi:hypothetical protein
MDFLKDPRVVAGGGVALALVAGIAVALVWGAGKDGPEVEPPASKGGLVIEVGQDDVKLDPTRKLPCYVAGASVGLATHAECAARNGVSSGQLDVGINQQGELAFGDVGTALTPLPPDEAALPPAPAPAPVVAPAQAPPAETPVAETRGPTATCWRYSDRVWVRVGDLPLNACVANLFDGRCERPGSATYGRWGEQTLRLVPGRVEQSPDNRNFRTLVEQGANCTLAPL